MNRTLKKWRNRRAVCMLARNLIFSSDCDHHYFFREGDYTVKVRVDLISVRGRDVDE